MKKETLLVIAFIYGAILSAFGLFFMITGMKGHEWLIGVLVLTVGSLMFTGAVGWKKNISTGKFLLNISGIFTMPLGLVFLARHERVSEFDKSKQYIPSWLLYFYLAVILLLLIFYPFLSSQMNKPVSFNFVYYGHAFFSFFGFFNHFIVIVTYCIGFLRGKEYDLRIFLIPFLYFVFFLPALVLRGTPSTFRYTMLIIGSVLILLLIIIALRRGNFQWQKYRSQ